MKGTWMNVAAIMTGTLLGLSIGKRFTKDYQTIVLQAAGLAVIVIGLHMGLKLQSILIPTISLVLGGLLGQKINLEQRLEHWGERMKAWIGSGESHFVQAFVSATLLYCVGALAIMGSIEEGIKNDPSILYTKSLIDGIISIALASTLGIGVLFSVLPVLLYQGSITYLARYASGFFTQDMILNLSATGGILILAIGTNMLEITRIRLGNLLPALLFAAALSLIS